MKKGGALLVVLALAALVAPLAAPYAPDAIDLASRRAAPSLAHWFGTDDLGRDVLSRALFGGRVSIAIGLLSALVAVSVGCLLYTSPSPRDRTRSRMPSSA